MLITIHPDQVAKKDGEGTFYQKALEGAETVFHEIKAHVDLKEGDEGKEHDAYGSFVSIFNMGKVDPKKPVGVFIQDLINSTVKMPSHTKKDLENKVAK